MTGIPANATASSAQAALWAKSKALETTFLSQMLDAAGFGRAVEGLGGGGIGEERFASFLRDEQARLMVDKGGIGLAEQIFRSLTREGS